VISRLSRSVWDAIALQRVEEACIEGRGAEVGAIVCGEGERVFFQPLGELLTIYSRTGTAALCLLSEHMTTIVQRLDIPVPRKNAGSSLHDKGLERFYNGVYTAFLRLIPFSTLRVIVLASPGFTKDALYDYIFAQATKANNKALLQARNKFR
jgi:protein pelota